MKYFLKSTQFNRKSVASSYHGREDGMLYQVAIVEIPRSNGHPPMLSIFDNQNGWNVTSFPTHLIFAGDKLQGINLLKSRYEIDYITPIKKGMHP